MKNNLLTDLRNDKKNQYKNNDKNIYQSLDKLDNTNNYINKSQDKSKKKYSLLLIFFFIILLLIAFIVALSVSFKKNKGIEKQNEDKKILQIKIEDIGKELKKLVIKIKEDSQKMIEEVNQEMENMRLEFNEKINELNNTFVNIKEGLESQHNKRLEGPIIKNGFYYIHCASNPNLVWEIQYMKDKNITTLTVNNKTKKTNQQFYFRYIPIERDYSITSVSSKMLIGVKNGLKTPGAKIQPNTFFNSDSQEWILKREGENIYSLKNVASNNYAELKENNEMVSNPKNNKNSQKFIFEYFNPIAEFNNMYKQKTI